MAHSEFVAHRLEPNPPVRPPRDTSKFGACLGAWAACDLKKAAHVAVPWPRNGAKASP